MLKITEKSELRALMSNEFHDSDGNFSDREPKAFLNRLSEHQRDLLDHSDNNQLLAFITAGDGYVERSMGLDFSSPDLARPMASFALFYKSDNSTVELAFYTRFFVISYFAFYWRTHIELRKIFSELQASQFDPDNPDLDALRLYQLEDMQTRMSLLGDAYQWFMEQPYLSKKNALDVTGFLNPDNTANCYYLMMSNRFKHDYPLDFLDASEDLKRTHFYFPYTLLRQKVKGFYKSPKWFGNNAIHGLYNTRGCWAIFRNFHWKWPNENADLYSRGYTTRFMEGSSDGRPLYEIFMEIYSTFRGDKIKSVKPGNLRLWQQMLWKYYDYPGYELDINNATDVMILKRMFLDFRYGDQNSLNHTYPRFLNLFTGVPFTERNEYIGLPMGGVADGENNTYKKTYSPEFGSNIYGQTFDRNQPWAKVYLFRAKHSTTGGFTPDYNQESDGGQFINVQEN